MRGLLFAVLVAGAAQVEAQQAPVVSASSLPVYFFGGGLLSPDARLTYGFLAGIGGPLSKTLSLEFSGGVHTGTPHNWGLEVFGTAYRYETIRRDAPFQFMIRYDPPPRSAVRTAFVVGGVLNLRDDRDYVIAACPLNSVCTSRPRSASGGESFLEPGFVVGAEVMVPAGGRFEWGPSLRLMGVVRGRCDSKGRACVSRPDPPGPFRVDVGVKAAWLLK